MAATHQHQVDKNFQEFQKLLPDLLKTHPGKYAVMNDGRVIEFFDTFGDAVRFGHTKFGDTNFSVQEITRETINLGAHTYALHQHSN